MLRLLDSAVALRLLSQDRARRYGLGALGSAMIGSPGIAAMVRHHAMLYADLADPVALLRGERGTELNRYWAYADGQTADPHPGRVTGYSALMAASQPMVAAEILRAVDLRKHRVLLDAGGGTGAFAVAAARANPGLRVMVLDLPAVAAQARQAFDREGLSDRATATGGTIFEDWPKGATVATLIRVLHDHDDPAVDRILAAAFRTLPSGGILVVAEPMAGTRGAEPVGAYFHFYLLAMKQGRPRTVAVIVNAIEKAGFIIVGTPVTRAPLITSIVVARRPPLKV